MSSNTASPTDPNGPETASETATERSRSSRVLTVGYGLVSYGIALTSILYSMGFVAGVGVPKTIDSGPAGGLGAALLVNLALLSVFAVQHSVMARPAFKRWWTRAVPASLERPTYVLLSGLALWLLVWQWRPIDGVVWSVETPALRAVIGGVYWAGWAVMLLATFMVDHFDLFGLRQVWAYFRGERPYEAPFMVRGFYRVVRHPIQLGLLIAFWAAADMSVGHLLFSAVTTAYILVALKLEERDLVGEFGDTYRGYRKQVFMLLPLRAFRDA